MDIVIGRMMGLQNGTGTERQIGMEIVCLQNGTGAETPKQIDEIRNQIPETRNQIDRNTEWDRSAAERQKEERKGLPGNGTEGEICSPRSWKLF
ncbi:MAG: hypothetical protein SOZ41_05135 [Candidatus Cryptobacteroides sp.]|nr:hypothetical protein [Candidatus Cryptobacteroides sp.]